MTEPPNRRSIVDDVFATGRYELVTKAGCGCFTEEVAHRLHLFDPAWGHLKKSGSQNQWKGHAVDAVLHATTGYAVDIIASSESPQAKPAWTVDKKEDGGPRYPDRSDLFIVPRAGCQGTGDGPGPKPPPNGGHPDEIAALKARLAAVETRAAEAATLMRDQSRAVVLLHERVQALETRPAPTVDLPALVVRGRTARTWGHAHLVELDVRKA